MARTSKWSASDRKDLLRMLKKGGTEQEIREKLGRDGKPMTASEFATQLKKAMVEAGQIKQVSRKSKKKEDPKTYVVTDTGRLSIVDFQERSNFGPGNKFTLEKPRSKSKAWRLVPVE